MNNRFLNSGLALTFLGLTAGCSTHKAEDRPTPAPSHVETIVTNLGPMSDYDFTKAEMTEFEKFREAITATIQNGQKRQKETKEEKTWDLIINNTGWECAFKIKILSVNKEWIILLKYHV